MKNMVKMLNTGMYIYKAWIYHFLEWEKSNQDENNLLGISSVQLDNLFLPIEEAG